MALLTISNYLADKLLDHTFGGTPYSAPATVYLSLYISDPQADDSGTEATYSNYARQAVSFGSVVAHQIKNDTLITFPAAGGAGVPQTISHIALHDAVTSGNLLAFAQPTSSVIVQATVSVTVAIGELVCEFV